MCLFGKTQKVGRSKEFNMGELLPYLETFDEAENACNPL